MEKIYSKVDPDKLLHIIQRVNDIKESRVDLIPAEQFIQCSTLKMKKGKTFKPHKHIWKNRKRDIIAQESWIVIRGSVKCIFYDLDDQIIATPILNSGDASFTLQGGHNYEILDDDTIVYEYKTGPYEGQELDKTFIG
jgi:cupin fold WbuC family metalloprotein|tara:strand:- start:338 stop:751 length:414 start_codon:yes stop_codon:yes gene_type:complete